MKKMLQFKLLAVLLMLLSVTVSLNAQTYSGGSGSEEDPYLISTKADLLALDTAKVQWGMNYFYQLTADLDMAGEAFTPIGYANLATTINTPFVGTFDGNNHVISNLTVTTVEGHGNNDGVGFIGQLKGTVKNLSIENISIETGFNRVATFVGQCESGSTITNCASIGGKVKAGGWAASFLGVSWADATSSVTNCYSTTEIAAAWGHSGIVGLIQEGLVIDNVLYVGTTNGFGIARKNGAITNAYYAKATAAEDARGVALTADELKDQAKYAGFDFDAVWAMGANSAELKSFMGDTPVDPEEGTPPGLEITSFANWANLGEFKQGATIHVEGTYGTQGAKQVQMTIMHLNATWGGVNSYNVIIADSVGDKGVIDGVINHDITIPTDFDLTADFDADHKWLIQIRVIYNPKVDTYHNGNIIIIKGDDAPAAGISWSTSAIKGVSDVITTGTLIEALNFSGGENAADYDATVNGVKFKGFTSGIAGNSFPNPTSDHFESTSDNVVPSTVDQYDAELNGLAEFEGLLSQFLWDGTLDTITLKGLTVGSDYQVQLLLGDKRETQAGSYIVIDETYGDLETTAYAATPGISIVGSFTATETSISFTMSKVLGETRGGAQINAYQLRDMAATAAVLDRSSWVVIDADVEDGAKEGAIDGDPATQWSTPWKAEERTELPHYITIDMGALCKVNELVYLPRQDQWGHNGTILKYRVAVSASLADLNNEAAWFVNGAKKQIIAGGEVTREDYTTTPTDFSGTEKEVLNQITLPLETSLIGRYLRIYIDSTHATDADGDQGDYEAIIAEVWAKGEILTPAEAMLDQQYWTVVEVDSEQAEDGKSSAIDGDYSTAWFTPWGNPDTPDNPKTLNPHHIVVDLGIDADISNLKIVNRQDVWGPNGCVYEYEVYISEDMTQFGEAVVTGSVDYFALYGAAATKIDSQRIMKNVVNIDLTQKVSGRYIKVVYTKSEGDEAGIAELLAYGEYTGDIPSSETAPITFIVDDTANKTATSFGLKGSWKTATGEYDSAWNDGAEHSKFFDDGTNGDATAGDNIWTVTLQMVPDAGVNEWEWGVNNAEGSWIDGNWIFNVSNANAQTLTYVVPKDDTGVNSWTMKGKIYPNPVSSTLNIAVSSEISSVVVLNIAGQEIMSFNNSENSVDVSSLNAGIYLVKVSDNENNVMIKRFQKK